MHTFRELKRAARQDCSMFPSVKMALAGDTATPLLATALRGEASLRNVDLQIQETDYGSDERELLLPDSNLRKFDAEYVVVYRSAHKFAARHAMLQPERQARAAEEELDFYDKLLSEDYYSRRTIIAINCPMTDDGIWGTLAASVPASLPNQIRRLNLGLQQRAENHANFIVCDLDALQAQMGRGQIMDEAVYATTELELSLLALPLLAERIINAVTVRRGVLRKVLIADLDNTLWGGIVSEDGISGLQIGHSLGIGRAYADIQRWIKKLVARGIILCIASKNDEPIAREAFAQHPDMILRIDDVAVFIANWQTKADNILHISQVLNISTDQMVFIDDNPFERGMVRKGVPGICVPELPEDPALWVDFLSSQHLFETATHSVADAQRNIQYRQEAARRATRSQFQGEDEYLVSLQMKATVEGLTPFNTPRAAQLTQRSNQFNLRTRRYTEAELLSLGENTTDFTVLCFSLADNYGKQGLISIVVLERLDIDTVFIDTWLMSCRVLQRGMEHFVANTIVETAKRKGFKHIAAEYIPTAKNAMVANLLPAHDFKPAPVCSREAKNAHAKRSTPTAVAYTLDVEVYTPQPCYIKKEDTNPTT